MEQPTLDPATVPGPVAARSEDPGALSLLALWRILWGRKWLIAAITIGFMLFGLVTSSSAPRSFTAETLLVLEDNQAALTSTINRNAVSYDDPTTAIEVFGSRRVIERVVDQLNLIEEPEFNPFLDNGAAEGPSFFSRVISALFFFLPDAPEAEVDAAPAALVRQSTVAVVQDKVRFLADPRSTIIRVLATTEQPQLSADLANAVAEAFLGDLLETRLNAVDRVVEQLGRRVSELRQDVRDRETALQAFLNEADTLDPEILASLGDETLRLRERLGELETQNAEAARLGARLDAIAALPAAEQVAAIAADPDLGPRANALGLAGREDALGRLRADLDQAAERRNRLAQGLRSSLDRLETQIATKSDQQLRYQQLQREAEASAEIYEFSVRRLNELTVQGGVESSGGRIVFAAETPQLPDGRGRLRTMVVLGILGLITAIGWVLMREATNQTIRSATDLQLVLPQRRVVPVPRAPRMPFFDEGPFRQRLLIAPEPTPYSEAIRRLRAQVLQPALVRPDGQGSAMVLQLTSDYVTAGKAVLAVALARSCALLERRVLLIGADLRSDAIARQIRWPVPEAGLQRVILGEIAPGDAIVPHDALGIDLLLGDASEVNPGDLLETGGFDRLLAEARNHYDVILVDTPPALAAADAALVAPLADRLLFVAGGNASTSESVLDAIEALPEGLSEADLVVLYGAETRRVGRLARGSSRRFARL